VNRNTALFLMIPALLLATAFRLAGLGSVPPGVTHDEAAHLQDASRIWQGARPIYLTSGYGREPLYDYVTAPLVGLLGTRVIAGRLSSALWGVALVAVAYAALRGPLGRSGALAAALLLAVSFWPLSTSRQILRSVALPVLLTAALMLFWRGMYGHRLLYGPFVGAGALFGLAFYTYMPARIFWVVPLLFWLSLALSDRPRWRRSAPGVLVMLAVMGLVAAPLLVYLVRHPGLEVRVAELAAPLHAALAGQYRPLLQRMTETALMFSHRGDVHWMYNLSGQPLLPPPLAALFYLGIAAALLRLRQPGPRLLLLWLLVGISPALVTGLESSSLRAIAAQPAVFGLCALPFVGWTGGGTSARRRPLPATLSATSGVEERRDRPSRLLGRSLPEPARLRAVRLARYGLCALLGLLVAWTTAHTAVTYFVKWAGQRDVRVAYHVHLAAEANHLAGNGNAPVTGISALYPAQPHDPAALAVLLGEEDPSLRWFDGRGALVFPPTHQARLLIPTAAPLDPALADLVALYARPLPPIPLRPSDWITQVAVLEWDPRSALSAALAEAVGPVGVFPGNALPSDHAYQPLTLPVILEDRLELTGYRLLSPAIPPGGEVALITFWQVTAPAGEDLMLFAHLLDDESHILGQADRLDAPSWNWHVGDGFAQVVRFRIPDDTPPGQYHLQVGVYRRADGTRLMARVDGQPVGDRLLLYPVEVREP